MNLEKIVNTAFSRLEMLFSGHVVSGLSSESKFVGIALTAVLFAFVIWFALAYTKKKSVPALLLLFSIFLLYLLIPFRVHVRWVPERTTLYLLLVTFLFLAANFSNIPSRISRHLSVIVVCISTLLIAFTIGIQSRDNFLVNEYMAEYLSGLDQVEDKSTILAIRVVSPMPDDIGIGLLHKLLQGGSYYAVLTSSVDVKVFQAQSRVVPIVYAKEMNPYRRWLNDPEVVKLVPIVDFSKFEEAFGRQLDYVLVWGNLQDAMHYERLRQPILRLLSSLEDQFTLIEKSKPNGYMRLFRNNAKQIISP